MSLLKSYKPKREIKPRDNYEGYLKSQIVLSQNHFENEQRQRAKSRDVSMDYIMGANCAIYNEPFNYKRIKPAERVINNRFEMVQTNYVRLKRYLSEDQANHLAQRKSNKISNSPSPIRKSNLLTTSNASAYTSKCTKANLNTSQLRNNASYNYKPSDMKYAASSQCISTNSTNNTSSTHHNLNQPQTNSNYNFDKALDDVNPEIDLTHCSNSKQKPAPARNMTNKSNSTTSTHYEYITPSSYNEKRASASAYNYKSYVKNKSTSPYMNYSRISVNNDTQSETSEKTKWLIEDMDRSCLYKATSQNALTKSEDRNKEEAKNSFIKTTTATKRETKRDMKSIDTIEEMHFTFVALIQNTKKVISVQEAFSGEISQRQSRQKENHI